MPYRLVFTKNGPHDEICAVPEGWVQGTFLYWPRSLKKSEIESLRSNPKSIPEKNWKRMKCRIKLSDISTFEEALRLEEVYSKFEDTEEEEMYLHQQQKKKSQTVDLLSKQLLDVDSEFDLYEDNEHEMTPNAITEEPEEKSYSDTSIPKILENSDKSNAQAQLSSNDKQYNIITLNQDSTQSTSINTTNEEILTINTSELYKIIQENNFLLLENKALKEELQNSAEFRNETKKNFSIMQTQLDKVIELLHKEKYSKPNDDPTKKDSNDIMLGNIKFPIETKIQLDELEYKLMDQNSMTYLVKKFSEICGTSGLAKLSKVGLTLVKLFIKDELLNQFTWKGIKGSTKMGFIQYVKIRELFHKVVRLADNSCSFHDTDLFLQNSSIKHSGQRLKRRISSSESKLNFKKTKKHTHEQDKSEEEEIIDSIINAEKNEDSTEVVNDNETNEEYSNITESNCESGTNEKSEDGSNRDIENSKKNEEISKKNKSYGITKKIQKCIANENSEKIDSGSTKRLQELRVNKEADNLTNALDKPSCSKVTVLYNDTVPKKTEDIETKKITDTLNKPSSSKVTILSDVKICNKRKDIENVKKMANISSSDVRPIFDDLIKFSP